MNRRHLFALLLALLSTGSARATDVALCTDRGRVVVELADADAPLHVANFLDYVDLGAYSGTVFHRVVAGFVVQGGGLDRQLRARTALPPVANESDNGLRNVRGSVAAARTGDPNSAAAQFFVNLADNAQLDAGAEPGYTVFGRIKDGMAVIDAIGQLPTSAVAPLPGDVPTPLVAIESVARLDEAALAALPPEGREAVLKERATTAAAAGNFADALQAIDHYRALCGAEDPEITLLEARSALAGDNRRRAEFVLSEFFATAEPTHASYEAAAALYREVLQGDQPTGPQLVDDCSPPPIPTLVDGAAADTAEMVAAQTRVREFIAAAEIHLTCLAKVIDDPERSAAERNVAIVEHNRMVSAMETTAAGFNEQIRVFNSR